MFRLCKVVDRCDRSNLPNYDTGFIGCLIISRICRISSSNGQFDHNLRNLTFVYGIDVRRLFFTNRLEQKGCNTIPSGNANA